MAYKVGPLPNRNRRKGSIGGVLLCAPIKGRTRLSYMPQFIANRIQVPNRIGEHVSCDCDWKSGPDGGMNYNSNMFEVLSQSHRQNTMNSGQSQHILKDLRLRLRVRTRWVY